MSGASLGALRAGPPLGLSGTRSWSPCLPVWWSRVLPAGPQGGGADRAPCPPGAWLLRGGCVSGGRGVAVGLSGPALPWVAGACGGACCHIKTEAQLSPRPLRTPDPGAPSLVCPSPQHSGDQEPRFPPTQTSSGVGGGRAKPRVLNAEDGGCLRWSLEMSSFVPSCPRRCPPGPPRSIRQALRGLMRPPCCWAVAGETVSLI